MKEKKQISKLRNWVEDVVEALIIVLIIRTFIIQTSIVPTGSMINTILPHDYLIVEKITYRFNLPKRGDIVVFKFPDDPRVDYIKRVIALPGEKVEIYKKQVFINDQPLDEPYKMHIDSSIIPKEWGIPRDYFGPITVPTHNLLVLGDNRDNSKDGRYWGFLDIDLLKGKPLIRIWPLTRIGLVK